MALRIVDNQMMMTRPLDMTAARAREMQQSGLTGGTIQDINRDAEDEMNTVQPKSEVEEARVRTDSESESAGNQEQPQHEKEESPQPEDEDLRKRASERLLNLPVSRGSTVPERRLDIRV